MIIDPITHKDPGLGFAPRVRIRSQIRANATTRCVLERIMREERPQACHTHKDRNKQVRIPNRTTHFSVHPPGLEHPSSPLGAPVLANLTSVHVQELHNSPRCSQKLSQIWHSTRIEAV